MNFLDFHQRTGTVDSFYLLNGLKDKIITSIGDLITVIKNWKSLTTVNRGEKSFGFKTLSTNSNNNSEKHLFFTKNKNIQFSISLNSLAIISSLSK